MNIIKKKRNFKRIQINTLSFIPLQTSYWFTKQYETSLKRCTLDGIYKFLDLKTHTHTLNDDSKVSIFKSRFRTKETWNYLRSPHPEVTWHRSIWFAHATPRYAFCAWLAVHNRLSTGERMAKWSSGINMGCSFCQDPVETRDHLFYSCPYSLQIWTSLTRGLLGTYFTAEWNGIMEIISDSTRDHLTNFITKYVFQLSIRLLSLQTLKNGRYDKGLQSWFAVTA